MEGNTGQPCRWCGERITTFDQWFIQPCQKSKGGHTVNNFVALPLAPQPQGAES